jgi:hypothetical protein
MLLREAELASGELHLTFMFKANGILSAAWDSSVTETGVTSLDGTEVDVMLRPYK